MAYASEQDEKVATGAQDGAHQKLASIRKVHSSPALQQSAAEVMQARHCTAGDSIATSSEPCVPGVPSTLHRAEPMEEARRCPGLISNLKGPPKRPISDDLGHRERRGEQGPHRGDVIVTGCNVCMRKCLGCLFSVLHDVEWEAAFARQELQETLAQTRTKCQAGTRPKPVWAGGLAGSSDMR